MYFLLTPRRQMGVAVPKDQLNKIPPLRGGVQIVESQCSELGRITQEAFILKSVSTRGMLCPGYYMPAWRGWAPRV